MLVEPQPDLAAFLVTVRKPPRCSRRPASSPDNAGQPLSLHVDGPLASVDVGQPAGTTPSSYRCHGADAHARRHSREAEAPAPIDLLVLDVDGHELDVLLGFDFQRWQPRLILIADPIVNLTRTGSSRKAATG